MADEMARHLHPVPPSPGGPVYVVGRSTYADAGSRYVVAQCVDDAVAAVLSMAGHETYRRDEMAHDPDLVEALAAWEADQDDLHRRELKARAAVTRSDRPASLGLLPHPSLLGKLLL